MTNTPNDAFILPDYYGKTDLLFFSEAIKGQRIIQEITNEGTTQVSLENAVHLYGIGMVCGQSDEPSTYGDPVFALWYTHTIFDPDKCKFYVDTRHLSKGALRTSFCGNYSKGADMAGKEAYISMDLDQQQVNDLSDILIEKKTSDLGALRHLYNMHLFQGLIYSKHIAIGELPGVVAKIAAGSVLQHIKNQYKD